MTTITVGSGGDYSTIQAAINAASAGDTISIAAGTYNENVIINKTGLTLQGAGDSTVIQGSFKADNSIADGNVENFLEAGNPYSQTAGRGCDIQADNVTIANVKIDGFAYGAALNNGTSGTTLDHVTFNDNLVGIHKGTTDTISGFTMTGGSMTDGLIGIEFAKSTTVGDQNVGTADDVLIDGTSFSHLTSKGMYFEALSNAHLTNITMDDVGQFGAPSTSGVEGSGGNGIDFNLKNGHYSNIELDNFFLTNTGNSDRNGADAVGHKNGGAVVVEVRDFGSYGAVPASYTGTVSIHDGSIDGTSTGVQVGEPGQTNLDGPAVDISNVTIVHADLSGGANPHGDITNVTAATTTFNGTAGVDSVSISLGSTGTIIVNAGEGDDIINGAGTGALTLNGEGGNDTLIGSSGNDTLAGGTGDDTYGVDNIGDSVSESSGAGNDTVISSISYELGDDVENLTLTDAATDTQDFDNMALGAITDGENGWTVLAGGRDQEVVDAGGGNHMFRMSSDPVVGDFAGPYSPGLSVSAGEPIQGSGATSQLIEYDIQAVSTSATDGSRIEVDFGNEDGTDRNNFMVIENTADGLRIAVSEPDTDGNFSGDDVDASPNDWRELVSGVDNSTAHHIEMRVVYNDGANNDVIKVYLDGNLIGETTTFENYRDALGGTHDDNAAANLTNRMFFRPSANGAPQDGPGGDNQGFYFDNLHTATYNNLDGTGNDLANTITGNSGDNLLSGMGGNDTISGGDGDDTIDGGTGVNTLSGDAGDDTLTGNLGDSIDGGTGSDSLSLLGTAGDDYVTASYSESTAVIDGVTGVETIALDLDGGNDTLDYSGSGTAVSVNLGVGAASGFQSISGVENVTGSSYGDNLTGSDSANIIDGGAGADLMSGGDGNDTYVVDNGEDGVTENADEGTDQVFSSISYSLGDNVENLTLTGSDNIDGTGNALANVIVGSSGDNTLDAGGDDDTVYGGAGFDTLTGGGGNDTLNGGDDDDVLIGGTGGNSLDGGTGADFMAGSSGDDTYVVDDAGDSVSEGSGQGHDTVQSSVTYTLTANVEDLVLTGTDAIDGTGNSGDNSITGNDGNNTLNGAAGTDTISGGLGDDTIQGGTGWDTLNGERGNDHVLGGLGKDTLTGGYDNDTLDGGGGVDTLRGGAGNDTLYGRANADTLIGGDGRDTMSGGGASDTFVFNHVHDAGNSQAAADVITDFVEGTNHIDLSGIDANADVPGNQAFTLIGSAAFSSTAGELRVTQSGGNTYVAGDTNGDGSSDFMIRLNGLHTLSGSDFGL